VNGVFAWGAQIELGSTATTYQRVTTATDYADVGLPRNLTFDGVDDSLATAGNVDFATWTVGTRRNLLTVPTMFDDAAWSKTDVTVTANAIAAPDGTTTADLFTAGTAGTEGCLQIVTSVANVTHTASFYAKRGNTDWVYLRLGDATNQLRGWWNLATGTIGTAVNVGTATGATETIQDVGNGWYRCTLTGAVNGGLTAYGFNVFSASGDGSLTRVNNSTRYMWGAQLETGSTATAFQDVGTDKVSVFSGLAKLSDAFTGTVVDINGATGTSAFMMRAPNANAANTYAWYSGGSLAFVGAVGSGYVAPITNVVSGIGEIGNDVQVLRVNGTQAATSASDQGTGTYGSFPLYVGRRGGTTLPLNGRIFQLIVRGAATDSVTVGNAERWVGQLTGVNL